MHNDYMDIKSKIKMEPLWYDSNGVPRYDKFNVKLCPNIYADEVILMKIGCQGCPRTFYVEMNWSLVDFIRHGIGEFSKSINSGTIPHYGDPPAHNCVGDTMNCEDYKIVEFWKRKDFKFKRIKKLEIGE